MSAFAVAAVICLLSPLADAANEGIRKSLPLEAVVDGAGFELRWAPRGDVLGFAITRENPDGSLEPEILLPGSASALAVGGLAPGASYEWRARADLTGGGVATGALRGGIDVALVDDRGRVLVCVTDGVAVALADELGRLAADLAGDGWRPAIVVVPAGATPQQLKAAIVAEHAAAPLSSVFLLGDLPVPYSGAIYPDGHLTHRGAWPADVYYADIDGDWTDTWRTAPDGAWERNHNAIGDGKFDHSNLPSDADLMVGRVDLSDLPAFAPQTEIDLLRGYLDRNHAFRHDMLGVARRALIDDHLSGLSEGVAVSARSGFAAALGRAAVADADWPDEPGGQSYLLGAGFGASTWTSVNGVGSTASFAAGNPSVVFSLFFGSYFGDWDMGDNFLRASIAGDGATLAAGYSGRPQWQVHALGLGVPLGQVARESQNARAGDPYYTSYSARSVHVALHGDPTLRLFPRAGANSVIAVRIDGGGALLTWYPAAGEGDLLGYNVYRGTVVGQAFERLNPTLLTADHFVDPAAPAGAASYQVRAIYRETTGSGTFINSAQGAFATLAPATVALASVEVGPAAAVIGEGGAPAVLTIKRSGDAASALVVALEYSGTASSATDFADAPALVTIPAGESEVGISIAAVTDGEAEGAEELVVSLAPDPESYRLAAAGTSCVTVYDDGYGVFAALWFGHDAANPEIGAPGADPDGDGNPNLIEFATGSLPLDPDPSPLAVLPDIEFGGVPYRRYQFDKALAAVGYEIVIEASVDLENWSEPAGTLATEYPYDAETQRITVLVPKTAGSARDFARLTVRSP